MKLRLQTAFATALCAVWSWAPTAAWAVDGIVLIDQARVNAAGGFPYRISQSGSYRLAGNLSPGASGWTTNAIEIASPSGASITVTLDLNGFSILGSPVCDYNSQGGVTCGTAGEGSGVVADAKSSVTLSNGGIRGMGLQGVWCKGHCKLDHLTVANNGNIGVVLERGGVVSNTLLLVNRYGAGLAHAIVQGNTVQWNLNEGVRAGYCTLVGNTISFNGGAGLAGNGNGYAHNHLMFNNGGASQVLPGNVQTAGNVCGTAACP